MTSLCTDHRIIWGYAAYLDPQQKAQLKCFVPLDR